MLAMGETLLASGKNKTIICTGVLGGNSGQTFSENDENPKQTTRVATETELANLAQKGVRVIVIRLPPSVHGEGDKGFIHMLIQFSKQKQAAGLYSSQKIFAKFCRKF